MTAQALNSKQNHLLANRTLAGANWTDINTTRLAGGYVDPFEGVQACGIFETVTNAAHEIYNSGSLYQQLANHWACASVYLKVGNIRNFGGLYCDLSSTQVRALWNLTTGANTLLTATGAVERAFVTSQDMGAAGGGGWWRFSIACYYTGVRTSAFTRIDLSTDGTTLGYPGDVTAYVLAFSPSFAFANWPGDVTDTTSGVLTSPIRNLAIYS
jgi:hypothetical protein